MPRNPYRLIETFLRTNLKQKKIKPKRVDLELNLNKNDYYDENFRDFFFTCQRKAVKSRLRLVSRWPPQKKANKLGFSTTTTSLYVDGNLVSSVSLNATGDTGSIYFGSYEGGAFIIGRVDDMRMYSQILSSSEISNIYTTTLL